MTDQAEADEDTSMKNRVLMAAGESPSHASSLSSTVM